MRTDITALITLGWKLMRCKAGNHYWSVRPETCRGVACPLYPCLADHGYRVVCKVCGHPEEV